MWPLVRALLFSLDAERAHALTVGLLGTAPALWGALARLVYGEPDPSLARLVGGVRIAGPVGLATTAAWPTQVAGLVPPETHAGRAGCTKLAGFVSS